MDGAGTVEKAIEILFHLHGQPLAVGVTALGRELGLPKSSAHRLLTALARGGLVERDEGGRYRPGLGLVDLGLGALEHEPVVAAARPVLEGQAQETGETFFLTAARAGRIVVLEKAEGSGFLRAAPRIGSTVPVHATAVGKLQLAFGPEALREVHQTPQAFTPRTLTDPSALAREVARARERGVAENRDEWIPGLSVVAAPVIARGRLLAAIAVAGATPRVQELGFARLGERVRAAARSVEARLEGRRS
jgi:DNA-binding IclR family transcriptional regulator